MEKVIVVNNLEKSFNSSKRTVKAVDGISFEIEKGSITGFLGPNGAGKTTTLKMMIGTILPDKGEVKIFGMKPTRHLELLSRKIGVVLEGSRNIYGPLTSAQNIRYFAKLYGHKAKDSEIDRMLEFFSILEKKNTPVMRLSRGMQQKVAICTALIHKPEVLFLDEPTLGLDLQSSISLIEALKKLNADYGTTVILTSHDMDVIQKLSTHLLLIKAGKLILNDKMERVMKIFDKKHFHLVTEENIDFMFDSVKIIGKKEKDNEFLYDVEVKDEEEFFKYLFNLQEKGVHFSSIERENVKLEDIFLEVIG